MKRILIVIILLLAAAAANQALSKPRAAIPRAPLNEFPSQVGDWEAVDEDRISDNVLAVIRVDDYLMRTYVHPTGRRIGLYIGYFDSQREGKQVHSPRQCLPGAGWQISEQKVYYLNIEDRQPAKAPINYYLMAFDNEDHLFLWWYQGRGRIYANEFLNKLYLVSDALFKRRTDGALVRVHSPIYANEQQALDDQLAFVKEIMPILERYIPD